MRTTSGELALVAETGGIGFVGGEHFLQDQSHDESLPGEGVRCAVIYSASELEY
jgi:hypothetical protein